MLLLPNLWQRKILFLHYSFLSSFNATFYGKEEWNTSFMYVGWHANNIFAPIWLLPISHSHMHVFLIVAYLLILISLIQLGWGCLAEVQVGMYFPFFRQTKVAQSSFFSCVLRGTWFGQKLEKQNLSGVIFFVAFYEHFYSEKGLNNCSIMKSFKKLSN